jgi:hypothetical protein
MKMAIVKKVKGKWVVTAIGLDEQEVADLRYQLEMSERNEFFNVAVPYRVVFHQNED